MFNVAIQVGDFLRNARRRCRKAAMLLVVFSSTVSAQVTSGARDTLHVYGPGGPLPAMKEGAAEFSRLRAVQVAVVWGPTPQWLE